ncbi:probable LRR receptor-like serine/threonine-protein kinase At3g47570 [Asparagus officinalis]|uniref:probable LRR receptor-like serine/threonine-protein kinase At3g47570 n=1 Tax=Asparagus officinalis TaxID=4686 RepID=UPI00098DEFF2|nr:probable LRR receptor-like serine/threonine-protein kinase At3g47570 [Asparagus officinalis]
MGQALLSFKSMVSGDPRRSLASWNDSVHFCREIDLSNNHIKGIIPQEIGLLPRLLYLDLSMNSLGGGIPASLSQCSRLEVLRLWNNKLQVSYGDLVKATNGFSEDNRIGSGSFGNVYKGLLDGEYRKAVAVKVLNLHVRGASRSFLVECEAMKNIRHRNLLKILTICSSVDFQCNDFKAVVSEFMDNGSLDAWLHPKANERFKLKKLNLIGRLNIVIDVAHALHYLHHLCGKPIVHRDLKPSNILLDDNMMAHVGDFGLAKFLKKVSSQYSTSSCGLKGTIGYIAPEYGMGSEVSTRGDVYSYGILLLEMFTGKRPTDEMFVGGLTLRMFVEMAFSERIIDIIDAHLFAPPTNDAEKMNYARAIECIALLLRIGITCSNELPAKRMDMGNIIKELHIVRDMLMRDGNQVERN